ncbi:MAG: hypothetical protein ACRDF6_07780, partial [bacterium]
MLVATVTVISMTVFAAAPAVADYKVVACRTATGQAGAGGWTRESVTNAPTAVTHMGCPGEGLGGAFRGGAFRGARSGWQFTAPPSTRIVSYRVDFSGTGAVEAGGPPAWAYRQVMDAILVGQASAIRLGTCGIPPCTGTHRWELPGPMNASTIRFYLLCEDQRTTSDCPARDDVLALIVSAEVTLADDADPEFVSLPAGDLVAPGAPVAGLRTVRAVARDLGSGVRRLKLDIDGRIVAEVDSSTGNSTCAEPFPTPVPCPSQFEASLTIDTASLFDGPHEARLIAEDAAGRSAITKALTFYTSNGRRPPNAPLTCAGEGGLTLTARASRRSVPYGSVLRLKGRVRGASPPEARILALDGVEMRPIAEGLLRKSGTYLLLIRPVQAGQARVILTSDGATGICSREIHFSIRPAVTLRISPRRTRNGGRITFRGSVRAPQLPPDGKSVLLRARAKGSRYWLHVATVRADPSGRFRFSYRFRRTFERTIYE